MKSRSHVWHAFALLALFGACNLNQSGNVTAKSGGDTTHPATRGSPLAPLQEACRSDGALRDNVTIRRQPYLQQVSTTSAVVGWVSTATTGERVDVTTVDGTAVALGLAAREETTLRSAGEHQIWTTLEGLEPDTIYCYTVANPDGQLSEPIGFRTAPAADSTRPVRFLAFGDSGGGGSDQYTLRDQMYEFPYELIVHTGDVAYDNGTIQQFEDNVFGVYADLFRHLPFFPAAGNHDYETLQGAPFRDVFHLSGEEKWYSYDWGRVHFAALDTEADYATQAEWLDRDLASTTLPWKIIYLHRPPYSSGEHGSDLRLRELLEPVLTRHGVQLVLAGHDHDYERMIPQHGVAHVVTGGGGRGTRAVGSSSFTAFADDVIHFVYVEVGIDELILHAIDGAGAEFDSMVVAR